MCGVMAFTAVVLSISSVAWCEFIEFEIPGGATPGFGAWRYQSFYLVGTENDVYKVASCASMPDSWDMDTKWMSSRVFSVLAPLLGILASISLFKSAKLGAGLFLLTTLFQGLTLLLLKSDLCDVATNPFFESLPESTTNSISDCKVARSGTISCVATSFFFVAAVLAALPREAEEAGEAAIDSKEGGDVAAVGDVGAGGEVAENKVGVPEETVAA